MRRRNNFNAAFKAKMALAALQESKTMAELSSEHNVHATQINKWRRTLSARCAELFEGKRTKKQEATVNVEELQRIIGEQAIQLAWYKKNLGTTI
jgi:transposase-like protein